MLFLTNTPLHFRFLLPKIKKTLFFDMLFWTNAPFHFRFLLEIGINPGDVWGTVSGPKMNPKFVLFGFIFEVIFWTSLGPILDHFWNHFGDRFGHRIGPRRAKRRPGGPSRAPSSEKVEGSKQANGGHFVAFWTSKTGLESPRSHPRGILRAPKTLEK